MPERGDPPYVEPISLTDTDTYLYEAIATLDTALAELTRLGLLTQTTADGGPVYEPADRGWSTAPEQGQGM